MTVQLIEDLVDRALGRADRRSTLSPAVTSADVGRHLAAIDANAHVDEMPQPPGRSAVLKRVVLKLTSFILVRQRAVNLATAGISHEILRAMDLLKAEMAQETKRQAAALAGIDPRLAKAAAQHRAMHEDLVTRVEALEARIAMQADQASELQSVIDVQRRDHALDRADLISRIKDVEAAALLERSRRQVLERSVSIRMMPQGERTALESRNDDSGTPSDDLPSFGLVDMYERFESWFRPSDSTLDDRFVEYVPALAAAAEHGRPVLDLGAGRGELLRQLSTAGVACYGIDSNASMVERAVAGGLDVRQEDLFEHLAALPSESIGAVVAIHVAEHLEPEALLAMVDEALRVLIPGGLLVMETPNPTNLVVGASSFHNDPTHLRPLTPDYLSFVCWDRGFVDVETRFLHPLPEYALELEPSGSAALDMLLTDVKWALKGPQDYAVIARRPRGR